MELNDRSNMAPYTRSTEDDIDPPNIVLLLNARQYGARHKPVHQLKMFAELKATVSEMQEMHCELPSSARSTFLMSFSHDCSKVASTHGDHNIYISDAKTGKHMQKLEGHPRTPWCIAFHPTSSDILASGCLAGEVRVWDLHGRSEKWKVEHGDCIAIASLTFHPFLQLLVIASGSCLYFWDWSQPRPAAYCSTNSELERVRYVKFDNYGHRLITGISNISARSSGSSFRSCFTEPVLPPTNESEDSRSSRRNASDIHRFFRDLNHSTRDRSPITEASSSHFQFLNSLISPSFTDDVRRALHLWESQGIEALMSDISEPETRRSESPNVMHISDLPIEDVSSDTEGLHNMIREFVDAQQARVNLEPATNLQTEPDPDTEPNNSNSTESNHGTESNHDPETNHDPEPSPEIEMLTTGEFWNTFLRLRTICTELESRLTRQVTDDPEPRADPSINNSENDNLSAHSLPSGSNSLQQESSDPFAPIIDILSRIRLALRFSTISLSAVRDRIVQVRGRIREIISRLRYWARRQSGGHIHQDIFEEMTVQLTEQMDRLLQADARLASTMALSHHRASQNFEHSPVDALQDVSSNSEHSISTSQQSVGSLSNERNSNQRSSDDDIHSASTSQVYERPQYPYNRRIPETSVIIPRRRVRHRRRQRQRPVTITVESDDESTGFMESYMRAAFESARMNSVVNEEPSSPLQYLNLPDIRDIIQARYPGMRLGYISDSDSDRSTISPPPYSSTYTSSLFTGNSRIALNDPLSHNHRIQSWDFSRCILPAIYDANANVVVRRCMIHNDASVDISQDGEKLVALISPEDRDGVNLMFGIFSLKSGNLGKTHCIWGYISNAVSVSFSPLAQYVVVGSAYTRPIYTNPQKAVVAQIIKINQNNDSYEPVYIRSFTQLITSENRFQQVSLNCVRWLPQSGLGIAYATNRGCLSICKPTAGEMFENEDEPAPLTGRQRRGIRIYTAIP